LSQPHLAGEELLHYALLDGLDLGAVGFEGSDRTTQLRRRWGDVAGGIVANDHRFAIAPDNGIVAQAAFAF
jgi:hypothetical protein